MSSVHAADTPSETEIAPPVPADPTFQPSSSTDPRAHENSHDPDRTSDSVEVNGRVQDTDTHGGFLVEAGDPGPSGTSEGLSVDGAPDGAEGSDHEQEHLVANTSDDAGQWTDEDSHDLKRVKVYELIGSRWIDQGTAFCFGDLQDNEALLIARAESDFNHVILSTTIRSNDVYQRQQDTLIVWTEPDGVDYALSFQDPEGCSEVWNFIVEVQRHMNNSESGLLESSPLIGPEPSVTTASIIRSGHLPQPQLGIMSEIDRAIKTLARTNAFKERICEYILSEDYIKAIIDVFHQAEDLESLENLHALCSCMQTILMLNDHSLYEHILEDELFFGVVGMLEYDPEFPTHKANYREFLHQTSRFHQPIPIRNEEIQRKVHHTYRLQFLKDVVLARAIDDSTFNVLNSCIIFNQIDIINHIQNDPTFLRDIVGIFLDDDLYEIIFQQSRPKPEEEAPKSSDHMDVDLPEVAAKANGSAHPNSSPDGVPSTGGPAEMQRRRREVVFLVQQLCVMGKNVQLPARMALFRQLIEKAILFTVQWALEQPESDADGRQMIAAAGEILVTLLDHDLLGARQHVMKQYGSIERDRASGKKVDKETLAALMCRVLVRSRDLAVQSQVGEALKTLMEVQQDVPDPHQAAGVKMMQRAKDHPANEQFMDYFYKQCMETLFRPFGDIPEFKTMTEPTLTLSRERTNLFLYLCDLLSAFALQHTFRSHFFILSSGIAPRVATLLRSRGKHLRLAAFRFFRALLRLNNNNMNKYLAQHDVFGPILGLTIHESRRDNLISSSCQEFFEYMRRENIKELITHCMTKHGDLVKRLADSPLGGPRFKALIQRYEMNVEPPPPKEEKPEQLDPNGARGWGRGKSLEAEEEDYFNGDDDVEEPFPNLPVLSSSPPRGGVKRKRARATGLPIRPARQPPFAGIPRAPALGSLVDYDDGDDATPGSPIDDSSSPTRSPSSIYFPKSPTSDVPSSPRIAHRQIPQKTSPAAPRDEEDDLLESLYKGGTSSPTFPTKPPDLGKRRRENDDDDELLERLASKAKRPSIGSDSEKEKENSEASPVGKVALTKPTEDSPGPKKIKLKFGAVGSAVASAQPAATSPAPSTGTKDGDNG
ncbi:hypothetical protein CERSUDRAFT_110962 [Gelatoporia subvermispora B]|uniref:Uncharacterized protein n=1 Tax=Ceriporiopsis subvermispora (strain B) TaxID=914234 RepID=M2RNC7_CERS8|nr:hypothetical protein CERSUDRAFT_110962 [Gelatoporia subvermispora B]